MRIRGLLYTGITACLFGLGAVLTKIVATALNPFFVAFLDMLIGGGLIVVFLLFRKKQIFPSLTRRMWVDAIQLSLLGTSLPLVCIIAGFSYTNAIKGGFLQQLQGIATLVFSLLLLGEKISKRQFLGIVLLLAGSSLIIVFGGGVLDWGRENIGDLLVVVGAIGLGYGYIPSKKLSLHIPTLQISVVRLLLGACFIFPITIFQPWELKPFVSWSLVAILFFYIFTNFCVGYITMQEGIRLLDTWEVGAIMQSVPLFSTIFAVLFLHDTLTVLQIAGGSIAIVGGLFIALPNTVFKKSNIFFKRK